jgi:steroid delta-isomerase-like uncharacterized protein
MRAEQNRAVVQAFVETINAQDWNGLDELVAREFIRHSRAAGSEVRSREQLKAYFQREFETFPDAMETVEDLIVEGDKVAARHRFHGTQQGPMGPYPPSGKSITADYLAIYRLEGGRIIEAWAEWDNLSGLEQLGHYTPPASSVVRENNR